MSVSKRKEAEAVVARMVITLMHLDEQAKLQPEEIRVMSQAIVSRVVELVEGEHAMV